MNTKINQEMISALNEFGVESNKKSLDNSLQKTLAAGVKEFDGCFLLINKLADNFDIKAALKTDNGNLTEFEFYFNEVDIQLIHGKYDERWRKKDLLLQGYLYAYRLAELLEKLGHFDVILLFQRRPMSCRVRFYSSRLNEPKMVSGDLNTYNKGLCLLVIET